MFAPCVGFGKKGRQVAGRQAVLFLKKKNQKNFSHLVPVAICRPVSRRPPAQVGKSFFGSFFSKKELLASF
jgi:hypothetical protein